MTDNQALAPSCWAIFADLVIVNLRALTGIVASAIFGYLVWDRHGQNLILALAFGGGWGLAMLYGVQLRGLVRRDGSVSWTGALLSSVLWVCAVGSVAFSPSLVLPLIDISSILTGVIYISARLGCHRIGCCDWKKGRRSRFFSLPMLEAIVTTVQISLALLMFRDMPSGIVAATFLPSHIATWTAFKIFRVPGE
ncbi:hypothetical protein [Xanthomonas bonasiae]|uniref:hypothetical protein n=1 Tax=Xanthomonas bonasiae TaxID=2810351 RepID=UPI0017831236|nr:hypothetical protein [Xanthomonas surreyensis]MBD7924455.1 hypothetical protein [Xanthomonas surreyensis]